MARRWRCSLLPPLPRPWPASLHTSDIAPSVQACLANDRVKLRSFFILALAAGGCTKVPAKGLRVGIMRLRVVGAAAQTRYSVEQALRDRWAARSDLRIDGAQPPSAPHAVRCRDDAAVPRQRRACAAQLARLRGQDCVVSGAIGRLGASLLVQLELIDRRSRVLAQVERSFVGHGAPPPQELFLLADALLPRPPPPIKRWHRRWWLWAIVAAAASGAVLAAVLPTALRKREEGPYVDLALP